MIAYRIADGKIAQHWMPFDLLGLMTQLTGTARRREEGLQVLGTRC